MRTTGIKVQRVGIQDLEYILGLRRRRCDGCVNETESVSNRRRSGAPRDPRYPESVEPVYFRLYSDRGRKPMTGPRRDEGGAAGHTSCPSNEWNRDSHY